VIFRDYLTTLMLTDCLAQGMLTFRLDYIFYRQFRTGILAGCLALWLHTDCLEKGIFTDCLAQGIQTVLHR